MGFYSRHLWRVLVVLGVALVLAIIPCLAWTVYDTAQFAGELGDFNVQVAADVTTKCEAELKQHDLAPGELKKPEKP